MKLLFFSFLNLFLIFSNAHAQISGTVFRDFNFDGTWQTAQEPGIEGIIINAYDASNTVVATTTSGASGAYTLPFTVPVRVEFEIPSTICINPDVDFFTVAADGNNVRFIQNSSSNINFAIQDPSEFANNPNPMVWVARFNRGDPLLAGTAATAISFLGHPYLSSGSVVSQNELQASFIGSVWGVAYSKQAKNIYICFSQKAFWSWAYGEWWDLFIRPHRRYL